MKTKKTLRTNTRQRRSLNQKHGAAHLSQRASVNYKKSGVDIKKGDKFVDWIVGSSSSKQPHKKQILESVGGFASLFKLSKKYKDPILVACTDGVGTKVKLAAELKHYDGIGQDLVAMCVNDLITTGAQPLFFLDYLAMGKLDLSVAKSILSSIRRACALSELALVGGETAEMPGVYQNSDFDCAGFSVGVVEKKNQLGAHNVRAGDVIIGLPSSGFHSNGYSLVRRIFEKENKSFKKNLLKPTFLYVDIVRKLQKKFNIKALAHITGSGIENLPRVLPNHLAARLTRWELPPLFLNAQEKSQISYQQMLVTFNCGFGMMAIVPKEQSSRMLKYLGKYFKDKDVVTKPKILGDVVKKTGKGDFFFGDFA